MPNRLINESSPYLLQHAHNPVDWYPWGEAALDKARTENKPIFLSIGYAACHWCHVMAHESFEDEAIAQILNRHFVSIKVDREERPDLDRIYMNAVQAMTGTGGWPMSVFITPDGKPFYGGTYFPPQPRGGLPSFQQLLLAIVDAWQKRQEDLWTDGQEIVEFLQEQQILDDAVTEEALDPAVIESAYGTLKQRFDRTHGGWGAGPKFPQPMLLAFLLRYHYATEDPQALGMVTQNLESMARGGLYDQLGGGFHRYTVDAHWLTPHFEKMLYDNAQLARVYLHAWQVTGNPLFRAVIEETLNYVMREMTHPDGGFFSTQSADTEGEEGKFYVWTPEEVRQALGGPALRFLELYGVTDAGNFEGGNILTFQGTYEEHDAISGARLMLFEARAERTHPERDEKVLTSWNGLMLAAFAEAAQVFGRADYLAAAQRNAEFLLRELYAEGRLFHVWKAGEAKVPGFLEDYTHLIEGLLALYKADFNPRWYMVARDLADVMVEHFAADVGLYDTADDAESLVVRPQEVQDNATPSGNAMAAKVLLALARLSGEADYTDLARSSLAAMQDLPGQHPQAFGQWLVALDAALATPVEVAIIGDPGAADTRPLLDVAREGYHPHRLVAAGIGDTLPLLAQREQMAGQPTAYVCKNHVCQPPVTEASALKKKF